tara:strand:- start:451 stop:1398 length:948 start_codon:yes stop_codon:yes gene_type:complete
MAEEQNLPNEEDVKKPEAEVEEKEVEQKASDVEIEIEDDTPVPDQNRKNLPKELVERLDSDELTEYDDKVKDKIYQLKKVWHDERREKERIARENQEAIKAAQKLMEENKKLKSQFANTAQNEVNLELEAAKKQYKDAYELGDSEKVLEAQQKLNEVNFKAQKIKSLQPTENSVKDKEDKAPAALPPDAKALEWQKKNDWFGKDDEMTSLALGLHEKLVKQNGPAYATTDEYYNRINETMRKRFPEHFDTDSDDAEVETKETTKAKPAAVVAPVTRTTSSKKIRLTTSQVNLAKKLGLSPEQYAKEMIRLENRNG